MSSNLRDNQLTTIIYIVKQKYHGKKAKTCNKWHTHIHTGETEIERERNTNIILIIFIKSQGKTAKDEDKRTKATRKKIDKIAVSTYW